MGNIVFIDGASGEKRVEKVYGQALVKWCYQSRWGRLLGHLIARSSWFSKLYGYVQDQAISGKKVTSFVRKFAISLDDFLPAEGKNAQKPYGSFNQFFTRRLRPGARQFCTGQHLPAPCEGRYLAYQAVTDGLTFPVKGQYLDYQKLLAHPRWAKSFAGGPLFIARLCPVDYHRFHFPDDGRYLDFYCLPGGLHSVNPLALRSRGDVFITNQRHVSILELEHFGAMALIEVGALCVGKIRQLHPQDQEFKRGEEKGMFLFGGSTVIGIGEPGKWNFSPALLRHTAEQLETYLQLGRPLGGGSTR